MPSLRLNNPLHVSRIPVPESPSHGPAPRLKGSAFPWKKIRRPLWLTVLLCLLGSCNAPEADAQLGGLLNRRAQVPVIGVEKVRDMQLRFRERLETAKKENQPLPKPTFVLVDVREEAETEVSVIPGAVTSKQFEQEPEKYKGLQVVAYCTSGYRSDLYAAKLIDRGIKAVNMKPSILGWCRAKLPLETLDRKATKRVHTYSSRNTVPDMYEAVH